jgi:MoaA/NifB/PqqE/SkfB family radical SAM enzyme
MLKNLHIDIVDGCNTKCIMCDIYSDFKSKFIDIANLAKVAEAMDMVESVRIGCDSETLMHPRLEEVFELFRRAKIIQVLSNGRLLGRTNVINAIVKFVDVLRISFDGAKKDTFEKIRGGIPYDMVINGLKSIKQAKPQIVLGFATTLMAENVEELPMIMDIAHELGVEIVDYGYLVVGKNDLVEQSLFFRQSAADSAINRCAQIAAEYDLSFHPRYFGNDKKSEYVGRQKIGDIDVRDVNSSFASYYDCDIYKTDLWVKASGNVMVCARKSIGNIYDDNTGWSDILKHRNELLAKIENDKTSFCNGCNNCYIRGPKDIESHFASMVFLANKELILNQIVRS